MEIKTIKGISAEKWMEFKALAARNNVPLGILFAIMLENYAKSADLFWNNVLSGKKIISDKEAEILAESTRKLRKERGFRV